MLSQLADLVHRSGSLDDILSAFLCLCNRQALAPHRHYVFRLSVCECMRVSVRPGMYRVSMVFHKSTDGISPNFGWWCTVVEATDKLVFEGRKVKVTARLCMLIARHLRTQTVLMLPDCALIANYNNGQSYLVIGGIDANWEFGHPNLPSTILLRTTRVFLSDGIPFPPTAWAGCMCDWHI